MPETRKPIVLTPTEGEFLDAGGDRYRVVADAAGTGGRYGLIEATVPPGGGPPPHVHSREDEGFYVLSGEVAVYVEGERVAATAGAFVNMPAGVPHHFRNETFAPARLLFLVAPGGMDGMFRLTGTPSPADRGAPIPPLGDEEKGRIARHAGDFGVTVLPPAGH